MTHSPFWYARQAAAIVLISLLQIPFAPFEAWENVKARRTR